MHVQERELYPMDSERLEKWVGENAIRHGFESADNAPNYSFKTGFQQLASGFFMIPENGFAENGDYCYPDIEGNSALVLGDFISFVKALQKLDEESRKEKSIEDWDNFFKEIFKVFFGADETDFYEDRDNPYQKIIGAWDSLKREMLLGFGNNKNMPVDFSVFKKALPGKLDANAGSSYYLSGKISCSNLETIRAVPHKVICCIGMNSKEFPRRARVKEMSLMQDYQRGDKDAANEDRLMFLETILGAKERLYISWVGQSEKTAEEMEPSSVIAMFLNNLKEQYGMDMDNFVTKHPLQPFSEKYFDKNTDLETYDNRWSNRDCSENQDADIWKWKIYKTEAEEKKTIDVLYRILSNAPKYFINEVCGISLPDDVTCLDNIEPFIVEKGLDEWVLADNILKNDNYGEIIKISKYRGELPSGKFAEKIIKRKTELVKEMQGLIEQGIKTFIKPGKDKGKYRLWHWLQHLELNRNAGIVSDIILLNDDRKPKKIRLPELNKGFAENEMVNLWNLADRLKSGMQPVFPNAAWEYVNNKGNKNGEFTREKRLSNAWNKIEMYSRYDRMAIGDAESFKDLKIENEFIECSNILFKNYCGAEV
jgi:exodeoxyribonuclease V gamma subunit